MLTKSRTGLTGTELFEILAHSCGDEEHVAKHLKVRAEQIKLYREDFPSSKATDDEIVSIILRSLHGHCTCLGREHPEHFGVFRYGTKHRGYTLRSGTSSRVPF